MTPSVRMIAALAVPVLAGSALALTASASGQDVTATGSTLNSGPSTVDVPITWHRGLLARPGTNDHLHVRVSGTTPAGKRVRFAHAHLRHGARDGGSIRLTVPKGKRRDFARATHIVVSTTQHYDSPSDANRTPDHAVDSAGGPLKSPAWICWMVNATSEAVSATPSCQVSPGRSRKV